MNDLAERALAGRLDEHHAQSNALTPQMLVDAIKQAVAPRLHEHDTKIAEHDVVIGAIKEAAPFLRDLTEFITCREGAFELGIDPASMPHYPENRLTICQHAGNLLTQRGSARGEKRAGRLDGSSVTTEFNTYRRGDVYSALRELLVDHKH